MSAILVWRSATAIALIIALLGSFSARVAECTEGTGSRPPMDCSPFLALTSDALACGRTRTNELQHRHWEPVLMRCFAAHSYNKRFYPLNPAYEHESEVLQLKYGAHLLEITSFGVRTRLYFTLFYFTLLYYSLLSNALLYRTVFRVQACKVHMFGTCLP